MLYFVSAELALGYWLFAFLSALGALQWVATRYRLGGLSFLDCSTSRVRGYVLAVLLVAGGAGAFFLSQWPAIFAPGPAGSELAVLFATSAFSALIITVVLATFLGRQRRGAGPGTGGDGGQTVAIGHASAQLYMPAGPTTLAPAVCLLPACPVGVERTLPTEPVERATRTAPFGSRGPAAQDDTALPGRGSGPERPRGSGPPVGAGSTGTRPAGTVEARAMAILARRLAAEGMVTLVVNPDEDSYSYPSMLAILPAAVAALKERPEVDPNRIGALGEDLGADLVIRATSTSKEIKAVVALAPILTGVPVGLGLLHEMSYLQAMRWARDHSRANLGKELNAVAYGARIRPRPFLLLYGEEDRLVGEAPLVDWDATSLEPGGDSTRQLQVIPGLGHLNLAAHPTVMQVVSQWFKEHL